eukprot:gene3827-gene2239
MIIIGLVEEHVLTVVPVDGDRLDHPIQANPMLQAQLAPELGPNLVATLAGLQRDDLSRHIGSIFF